MALVEVCALHAPSTAAASDRTSYRNERIATLRERLATYRPTFALFYGLTYRQQYEKVAGGAFDEDEFRWSADTLCVLTLRIPRLTCTASLRRGAGASGG